MMLRKPMAFLRLGRVGMSPLTMSVPVLGTLTASNSFPVQLLLVGLAAHFFGFGLNDIIDHPIDRDLPYRQRHPLTTGYIRRWEAWAFVLLQIPVALAVYSTVGSAIGLGVLVLSMCLSVIYNLFSKRGAFSRLGAEIALAMSVGFLCLAGAYAQTDELPPQSYLFALVLSLILLLLNSVPSGLKDIRTDAESGVQSFVLAAGGRMLDDDHYSLPARLRWYSGFLQMSIVACIGLLIFYVRPPLLLAGLITLLTLYSGLHLRMLLQITSFRALRASMPLLSGYYHYAALSLFVVDKMPLGLQALYVLLLIGLMAIPIRLSFVMWRHRSG